MRFLRLSSISASAFAASPWSFSALSQSQSLASSGSALPPTKGVLCPFAGVLLMTGLLLSFPMKAFAGEACGSKSGYLNQLASEFLIPDQFPPETELLKNLVADVDYQRCQRISVVSLGESCLAHDECYAARLPKFQCDEDLKSLWIKACRKSYRKLTMDNFLCKSACEAFVDLMSDAQRYDSEGFCPSCEAYYTSRSLVQ